MSIASSSAKLNAPQPAALRSNATDRAYNSFLRAVGRETTKANKADLERAKAFGETMPRVLESLDEDQLAGLFFLLERSATVSNRRKIATHPRRPESVDEMLAEAAAEGDEANQAEALADQNVAQAKAETSVSEGQGRAKRDAAKPAQDDPTNALSS